MSLAAMAPRLHPAAWAVALALHGAALALLLPRPRDLPPGPAFSVALSGFRGATEADATVAPDGTALAEAPAPEPPAPPAPLAAPIAPPPAPPPPSPGAVVAPPPAAATPARPPTAAMPAPREVAVAMPQRAVAPRATPVARVPAPAAPGGRPAGAGAGAPGPAAPASPGADPAGGREGGETRLPPDYAAAIERILRRGLRYPPPARELGIEGTAMVRFAIARDGTVLSAQLVRGSGSVLLDHEALALLRRVSPLPRLPEAVPGASAAVIVPIGFALN